MADLGVEDPRYNFQSLGLISKIDSAASCLAVSKAGFHTCLHEEALTIWNHFFQSHTPSSCCSSFFLQYRVKSCYDTVSTSAAATQLQLHCCGVDSYYTDQRGFSTAVVNPSLSVDQAASRVVVTST